MADAGTRAGRSGLAALLYVVLAVLLPGWHLAAHRADHDHGGGGIRFSLRGLATTQASSSAAPHAHLHGPHTHHDPADSQSGSTHREESLSVGHSSISDGARGGDAHANPSHALGSLLHFSGAYLAAEGTSPILCASLLAANLPRLAHSSLHRIRCSGCPLGARAPPPAPAFF